MHRLINAAMWFVSALMIGSVYAHANYNFWRMATLGEGGYDLLLRPAFCAFVITTCGAFFMRGSLTIGPDEVVLQKVAGRIRIRQNDIVGRCRSFVERVEYVDDIFSRQRSGLSIRVPLGIKRDTLFNMWLHALPELDGEAQGYIFVRGNRALTHEGISVDFIAFGLLDQNGKPLDRWCIDDGDEDYPFMTRCCMTRGGLRWGFRKRLMRYTIMGALIAFDGS